ncbi:MAG TPA: efflux RND transporter periplasmic adaptor subunit [Thermoanaerobaculia bacterium]|nr:efflux RND transporter periplasmic adaptor subunit [Thermoanaerobaculia bacterium]
MSRLLLSLSVLALCLGAASACTAESAAADAGAPQDALAVRRGTFTDTFLLTGELEAARGAVIAVPRLPSWQTSIKWIAIEGTDLSEGDRVVELDNSEFASSLESKRSALTQSDHELSQKRSENSATIAEKQYDLERRKSDLEKAEIRVKVPAELLSRKEVEERTLDLERARTEYEKALSSFEAAQKKGATEVENVRLARSKTLREVTIAEDAIQTLILTAPQPGIFVIGDHPWEGRKMQLGDTVFVGLPIGQIPDLSTLQVVGMLADVDDGKIAAGMKVRMTLDAWPRKMFEGRIREIAPVAQEIGRGSLRRGFRVIVPLGSIEPELMRPGFSVRLEVERARREASLLAPRAGLNMEEKKARLRNGKVVDVELGPCNGQVCVVEKGLDEGAVLAPWRLTGEQG